jgi:hypothetical protein
VPSPGDLAAAANAAQQQQGQQTTQGGQHQLAPAAQIQPGKQAQLTSSTSQQPPNMMSTPIPGNSAGLGGGFTLGGMDLPPEFYGVGDSAGLDTGGIDLLNFGADFDFDTYLASMDGPGEGAEGGEGGGDEQMGG